MNNQNKRALLFNGLALITAGCLGGVHALQIAAGILALLQLIFQVV